MEAIYVMLAYWREIELKLRPWRDELSMFGVNDETTKGHRRGITRKDTLAGSFVVFEARAWLCKSMGANKNMLKLVFGSMLSNGTLQKLKQWQRFTTRNGNEVE